MRSRQYIVLGVLVLVATAAVLVFMSDGPRRKIAKEFFGKYLENQTSKDDPSEQVEKPRPPFLKPKPEWTPPPIRDPFPALSTSMPPPIPRWNIPRKDLHKKYGINYKPPLLIGFTRNWPMLLQAVVSYITAGWPPDQIHVIENTGVQRANLDHKLTLQNPFYLNHTQLHTLGVNIIRTPVLLSFSQLQNFYMHLAQQRNWPYYFWSHMDVLVLSYEDGNEFTPPATDPGYKTLYELSLAQMSRAMRSGERWAVRFFAYDHLTLVNRKAYEEVGGWDTLIPYYMTDCDMHSRLSMHGWAIRDTRAGHVTDVGSALENLLALYRDPSVEIRYIDANPPPPEPSEDSRSKRRARVDEAPALAYWRKLRAIADEMFSHKHTRDRNMWQVGQQGGQGEPFYYNARGMAEGIDVLTEAGREVYRRKWGHRDCDLLGATDLKMEDQWMVEKDWE